MQRYSRSYCARQLPLPLPAEQPPQITAENGAGRALIDARRRQSLYLCFENVLYPSSRKPRRIGAEQKPFRPQNLQRFSKHLLQTGPARLRPHPLVGTRSVEINVGTQV